MQGDLLLTGSTGFLGGEIVRVLSASYLIDTLSRNGADYNIDIAQYVPSIKKKYDVVVHAAGKAHSFSKTSTELNKFKQVNVIGTENLLASLKDFVPKAFVFISSVAVYGISQGLNINEDSPLIAEDAYGKTKIDAEHIIINWCKNHNVICSILRLPLIAGSNPPGNLRTMIEGIKKNRYRNIGGGNAKKSIVLAKDVAGIIPIVANVGGIYNLTDGYHPSFRELALLIAKQLGKNEPGNISAYVAKLLAKLGDILGAKAPINSEKLNKLTSSLTFNDDKARKALGWAPTQVLKGFFIK